jgi:hypothetical protein
MAHNDTANYMALKTRSTFITHLKLPVLITKDCFLHSTSAHAKFTTHYYTLLPWLSRYFANLVTAYVSTYDTKYRWESNHVGIALFVERPQIASSGP